MGRITALFAGIIAMTVVSNGRRSPGRMWTWLLVQWTALRAAVRLRQGLLRQGLLRQGLSLPA